MPAAERPAPADCVASLVKVSFPSIYKQGEAEAALPSRMAYATPDTKAAAMAIAADLSAAGGRLVLSDMFRSRSMQAAAHLDFVEGRKRAFSPPAGGSFHEAGRAFDLSLEHLKIPLKHFWVIAARHGVVPIIPKPVAGVSESWHFECRGSHARVHAYYAARKGVNFETPYKAAAASAIVAVGIPVSAFGTGQPDAYLQSAAIRLGADIGNLDGRVGQRTRDGLAAIGITGATVADMIAAADKALRQTFPGEFAAGAVAPPV